jgi:hypothetical protein
MRLMRYVNATAWMNLAMYLTTPPYGGEGRKTHPRRITATFRHNAAAFNFSSIVSPWSIYLPP